MAVAAVGLATAAITEAASRDEVLALGLRASDRVAAVREVGRAWQDAPYLVGTVLIWEQLQLDGSGAAGHLWDRVDEAVAWGSDPVLHGDQAAYAQAALDLYRLAPADDEELRAVKLGATDGPLEFARLVVEHDADAGPPIPGWWVGGGYGARYWQDDLFMVVPWLAMRGSGVDGLPAEAAARNLAWEWIEAYAYDHRKALDDTPDAAVPSLAERRRAGWALGDPASGRLLFDPASGLWWHDAGDAGGVEHWGRGNGWVAAGLVRAQHFLDGGYSGSRFGQVVDRTDLRRMLARMAVRLARERNTFGTWNADIVRRQEFAVPESSGSALLTYMLARGVNEGWLDEEAFAPVVLKAFHALSRLVDEDGDLHHVQGSASGPNHEAFMASDQAGVNLNFGVGALLMAAAEVARLPADRLRGLEEVEAVVLERGELEDQGDELVATLDQLGAVGELAPQARALAAISGQQFLEARYSPEEGGVVRIEDRGEGDVALFVDPGAQLAAMPERSYLLAAVAGSPWLWGRAWRSDVVLHNPGETWCQVQSSLLPGAGGRGSSGPVTADLPPGASVVLHDPMGHSFDLMDAGTVTVVADCDLAASARLLSLDEGDRVGLSVPALERHQVLVAGEEARLLLLGRSPAAITNLGCVNLSSRPATVRFAIFGNDSLPLGEVVAELGPRAWWQRTDALADLGSGGANGAYAVARVEPPGAAAVAFAALVDVASGDPVLVLPVPAVSAGDEPGQAGGLRRSLYLPGAAHAMGALGSEWRTDLELHNPGPLPVQSRVDLLAHGQDNSAPVTWQAPLLPAGSSLRVADVLVTAFGADGSATLRVRPEGGTIMAAARTYSVSAAGTRGQLVPGVAFRDALRQGEVAVLSHLCHEPGLAGWRTNIGVVSAGAAPTVVRLRLRDAGGQELAVREVALAPFGYRQLNDVFAGLVPVALEGASAAIWTDTLDGVFVAYASVVDNQSGDAFMVLARRLAE